MEPMIKATGDTRQQLCLAMRVMAGHRMLLAPPTTTRMACKATPIAETPTQQTSSRSGATPQPPLMPQQAGNTADPKTLREPT